MNTEHTLETSHDVASLKSRNIPITQELLLLCTVEIVSGKLSNQHRVAKLVNDRIKDRNCMFEGEIHASS